MIESIVRRLVVGSGLALLSGWVVIGVTPDAFAGGGGGGKGGAPHGGGAHGGGAHDDDDDSDDDSDDHDSDDHDSDDHDSDDDDDDSDDDQDTLYVWGSDPGRVLPDFVAVIDFDPDSEHYGEVLSTVEVPPPNASGNESHHCNLSADKNVLACGGLLSLLKDQDSVFFFDVSDERHPEFLGTARTLHSSITDDFYPIEEGGFLVTMMGSATGGGGGRVAEFDGDLNLVAEYPDNPDELFNPHGIAVRPELNLMVTSDFLNPVTSLNVWPGDMEFRSAVRVWDYDTRTIVRKIDVPGATGTMDVKLIPGDPEGRAVTAGMLSGLVYTIDTATGVATQSFDCEDIVPHVETDIDGGMVQLVAMPQSGDRMIFASFQAGQVGMLDTTNRYAFSQVSVVDLGFNSGPHTIVLTPDDSRLVVTDYFLEQDDFGKVHFDGDHQVHVINVTHDALELDTDFVLDFDTAFPVPARPHGLAIK